MCIVIWKIKIYLRISYIFSVYVIHKSIKLNFTKFIFVHFVMFSKGGVQPIREQRLKSSKSRDRKWVWLNCRGHWGRCWCWEEECNPLLTLGSFETNTCCPKISCNSCSRQLWWRLDHRWKFHRSNRWPLSRIDSRCTLVECQLHVVCRQLQRWQIVEAVKTLRTASRSTIDNLASELIYTYM